MTSRSLGYRSTPSRSKVSTKAWWLKPAVTKRTSWTCSPTADARKAWVSRTEWHRPTTRWNGVPAYTPQGNIAIGLL